MEHGYTKVTESRGGAVTKTYEGPGASNRQRVEHLALVTLAGSLPVPEVLDNVPGRLTTQLTTGRHGQDLIEDGRASQVLAGCGRTLRSLHTIDPGRLFDRPHRRGSVIVHGDFGPNNLLFTEDGSTVAAILDWEFCHEGEPIEDLAWCEWIIRAHHPHAVGHLPMLFDSYGWTPPWPARQQAMRQRCASLVEFCRDWDARGEGVALWEARARDVSTWTG